MAAFRAASVLALLHGCGATAPVVLRSKADIARCQAARCRTSKPIPSLALRYVTYANELLLVTPHKGGSRYAQDAFAALYNCSLKHLWYGEARSCGEGGGPAPPRNYTVVLAVRDPIDRLLAAWNHFGAASTLGRYCDAAAALSTDERAAYSARAPREPEVRLAKFVRWLRCLDRIRDLGAVSPGPEWRHVQPLARYAFAAEARLALRVDDLSGALGALAARLPALAARIAAGSPRPPPWLSDDERLAAERKAHKAGNGGVRYIRGSELATPWALRRPDLANVTADVTAAIRRLYAADWACFPDALPDYAPPPPASPPPPPRDPAIDVIKHYDVPEALDVPEVFPRCRCESPKFAAVT